MSLIQWRPNRDLLSVQNEMNRVFDQVFGNSLIDERENTKQFAWQPRADIKERDDAFVIIVEVPGIKKEDIHVVYKDGVINIEGERKREENKKEENYHREECYYGKFCRSFKLPTLIKQDKISASYRDGILQLELPKADEVKPKEIEVSVS